MPGGGFGSNGQRVAPPKSKRQDDRIYYIDQVLQESQLQAQHLGRINRKAKP